MPLILREDHQDFALACWETREDLAFFEQHLLYRSQATHTDRKRQQFSSRMALKQLLPEFPFDQVVREGEGKPRLLNEEYDFSLTHTQQYSAAIISGTHMVGVDMERIDARLLKVEKRFLHAEEYQLLPDDSEQRIIILTLCWSIKETVFKCFGRSAVDFAGDIRIHAINVDLTLADIEFIPFQSRQTVFCKKVADHWLTALAAQKTKSP